MSDQRADTVEYPITAKLFKHFGPSPVPVRVEFGALSHPGKLRPNNEDHYLVVQRRRSREVLLTNLPGELSDPTADVVHLLAVADGMGGAAFGELACITALRCAFDLGHSASKWVFRIGDNEIRELQEQIEAILKLVHRELVEQAGANPNLAGMGTTLTGAYLLGLDALIAHVGDSRAYLFRDSTLRQLTRDHTLAQQMIDAGQSNPDLAKRHVLTNCLGGNQADIFVDFSHIKLHDGDRLLFCTDGLFEMVADALIAGTLALYGNPQEVCTALVDLALEHGGKDNITTVVADFTVLPASG